jgi:hypothetical protein
MFGDSGKENICKLSEKWPENLPRKGPDGFIKFEILSVVKMSMSVFVTPCGLAGSALKLQAVCFTEPLVSVYRYTQRYKPED